jgi:hypothetical protein
MKLARDSIGELANQFQHLLVDINEPNGGIPVPFVSAEAR